MFERRVGLPWLTLCYSTANSKTVAGELRETGLLENRVPSPLRDFKVYLDGTRCQLRQRVPSRLDLRRRSATIYGGAGDIIEFDAHIMLKDLLFGVKGLARDFR